ncbi:hypothetical protein HYC85_022737 [Camellia sinensis]|uniref:Glutamate--cysteine ligase n=1 Tax=Camellia sinensis TaxID=4442 RepID=A0A7J7GGE3_CAMSI|nr:hypothetical protein HYC85_022737 [Camellia sinensis]
MLCYVFTNVFQKMGPRGSVLMHFCLVLSLEVQSGIPRFCTSARAGKCTLERRIRASSISLHWFAVRSSGGLGARAESCLKLERASSGDFTHPAFGNLGLLAGYGAKPIGPGLGRDRGHNMAHLSQVGPSHCIHSENIRSKVGYSLVFNIGSGIEVSKFKETCTSFPSLSSNYTTTMHGLHLDSARVSYKRGHRSIVNASPPIEDAVIATEPLTKEDLVAYLAFGCKPKEKWRIGTEHEKFGFESENLRPMKYEQISELLNGIAERFDWDKITEVIPEDQDVVDANDIEMNGGFERDHGDEFSIGGNDLDYEFDGSNTISGLRETEMSRFNDKNAFKEQEAHKAIAKLFCCAALPTETVEEFYYISLSVSADILRYEKRYEYPQDYLCLTAYFIDDNWKLKKWILRFSQIWDGFSELPHKIILKFLKDWDIEEKISTITMLNDNLYRETREIVKDHIQGKGELQLNGRLFKVCCCGDIASRMVQVAYKAINNIIDNVHELCSFGKSLPLWYLTSAQLKDALKLEPGGEFSSQDVQDNYEVPSAEEWEKVEAVTNRLRLRCVGLSLSSSSSSSFFLLLVRSTEDWALERVMCLKLERIERPSSGDSTHPALLTVFTERSSE